MAWPNPNAANTNMSPWNQSTPVPGQMMSANAMGGAGYPDNWESMQQWQQWAQWQQQYAQWHNQYGDKYAAQMAAIQTMTATGRPPLPQTNMVVGGPVPPPPDKAPPPPPPHENDLPLFGQQTNSASQHTPAPVPAPAPAPVSANVSSSKVGSSSSNNTSNSGNTQNWSYSSKNQIETSQTGYNSEALKKLAEEERTFDIQFKKWEQEIETWKRDNINHPDKQTYNEYKEKYEACRKQLLLRREQMQQKKRKLLEKSSAASDPALTVRASDAVSRDAKYTSYSSPQTQNYSQNQYSNQGESHHPSDKKNIEPQDRYDSYDDVNEEYQESSDNHADFLTIKSAGKSIPGLDLVAEEKPQKQPDVIEILDDNAAAKNVLDYSKISMGINSILGDEKIMNMLSMVASRQDLNDEDIQQRSASLNKANLDPMQTTNTWDRRNDNNMYDNRQTNSFNRHGSFDRQQGHGQSQMQQHEQASNHAPSTLEHNQNFNNVRPLVHPNYGRNAGPQGHSNYSGQVDNPEYVQNNRDQGYNNQNRMPYNKNANTPNQGRMEFNQERQYPPPNMMQQNHDQRMFNQERGPNNQNMIQHNPDRMPYNQNRMPQPSDGMAYQDRNPNANSYNQEKNMPPSNPNQNRMFSQDRMQLNRDQAPLNHSQGNKSFNQSRNFPNQNMPGNNMNEPNAVAPQSIQDQNGGQNAVNHSVVNEPEEEEVIYTPAIIVDYEHIPMRLEERNFIEAVVIKDYNHVSELDIDAEKIYESEFEQQPNFGKTQNTNNFDNNMKDDRIREREQRSLRSRERESRNSSDRDIGDSRGRDYMTNRERDYRDNREQDYRDSRERDYINSRDSEFRAGRDPDLRGSRDANFRDTRNSSRVYDRRPPREDERLPRGVDSYNDRRRSIERSDDSYGYRRNDDRDRYSRRDEAFSREPNRFRLDRREDNRSNSTDSDLRKRGPAPDQFDDSKRPRMVPDPDVTKNIIMIDDILELPGREVRPDKILIILRGPPGSGKSYLAKLIKDRENEHGGSARIMSIDDYFMQESEVDEVDPATGKSVKKIVLRYEYDAKSEKSYEGFLKKAIKKTITDGYFSFLIYDAVNDIIASFSDIIEFARHNQFKVYVCSMEAEAVSCWRRNVHGRSRADIEAVCARFESSPSGWLALDAATLLQRAAIDDVDMEDAHAHHDQPHQPQQPQHSSEVECSFTSKWEKMDDAAQLARLDGTSRPLRPSHLTMGDYLQLDEWQPNKAKPGKKTVRWADIEERREQEKMRAIGFVVGQTDWGRMTDPTMGSSALTQTKYIERVTRNK